MIKFLSKHKQSTGKVQQWISLRKITSEVYRGIAVLLQKVSVNWWRLTYRFVHIWVSDIYLLVQKSLLRLAYPRLKRVYQNHFYDNCDKKLRNSVFFLKVVLKFFSNLSPEPQRWKILWRRYLVGENPKITTNYWKNCFVWLHAGNWFREGKWRT